MKNSQKIIHNKNNHFFHFALQVPSFFPHPGQKCMTSWNSSLQHGYKHKQQVAPPRRNTIKHVTVWCFPDFSLVVVSTVSSHKSHSKWHGSLEFFGDSFGCSGGDKLTTSPGDKLTFFFVDFSTSDKLAVSAGDKFLLFSVSCSTGDNFTVCFVGCLLTTVLFSAGKLLESLLLLNATGNSVISISFISKFNVQN